MITKKVIDSLYKRYGKRPDSTDELNIALLFEAAHPVHDIVIENERVIINSVGSDSPFHSIPLKLIHAIVEFDEAVAIVLHSSIIFLSRQESDHPVSVHLKDLKPSLKERVLDMFGK